MARGLIIGGGFGELLARQKSGKEFEVGELLVAETGEAKHLLQVYDLDFSSQVSQQNLEYISGMQLEEGTPFEFMEPHLRHYTLGRLKGLATLRASRLGAPKALPAFFSELRDVREEDMAFLGKPAHALFLGNLRSGSRILDVPVHIDAKALSHHILIPATTGRGKSNLVKCLLWKLLEERFAGMLVLDPHDEYREALERHPNRARYYSPDPVAGAASLTLNVRDVRPEHFSGAVDWSGPQQEALSAYWKHYGREWVEAVVLEKPLDYKYHEGTLGVVRRRVMDLLSLAWDGEKLHCEGSFTLDAGTTTVNDICQSVMDGRMVVLDTSRFDGREEVLVGSMIVTELFRRYKRAKLDGSLRDLPTAGVVIEEAPRVLGKEVLERGRNIFGTIAREGRKFKVGLVAITQLPSLIPRQVLANMNTKIVLGLEMKPERQAIIESAAQDLSSDDRAIASLDKGEAVVTSTFAPFALPVKVPLFDDIAASAKKQAKGYPGL